VASPDVVQQEPRWPISLSPPKISKILGGQEVDLLGEAALHMLRELMEIEVTGKTGAALGERSPDRVCLRNGYRERRLDTRVGTIELPIPKPREGSYFPSFLEPPRRAEEALFAVITEAYIHGVSTRKVEELAHALGIDTARRIEFRYPTGEAVVLHCATISVRLWPCAVSLLVQKHKRERSAD